MASGSNVARFKMVPARAIDRSLASWTWLLTRAVSRSDASLIARFSVVWAYGFKLSNVCQHGICYNFPAVFPPLCGKFLSHHHEIEQHRWASDIAHLWSDDYISSMSRRIARPWDMGQMIIHYVVAEKVESLAPEVHCQVTSSLFINGSIWELGATSSLPSSNWGARSLSQQQRRQNLSALEYGFPLAMATTSRGLEHSASLCRRQCKQHWYPN